jgi:hypothetical protein
MKSNVIKFPIKIKKPRLVIPACAGKNCGCTDGVSHSFECRLELERSITSGVKSVKSVSAGETNENNRI